MLLSTYSFLYRHSVLAVQLHKLYLIETHSNKTRNLAKKTKMADCINYIISKYLLQYMTKEKKTTLHDNSYYTHKIPTNFI
jgi:hypothetical protein